MTPRRPWAWVLGVATIASLGARPASADKKKPGVFDFESWKSPVTREREAAGQIAPGGLDLSPAVPHTTEPRLIRVRVYADSDYRAVVLRWQARLRAQFGRVNAVAQAVFNVSFEIESLHDWDRSHGGAAFDAISKELVALDEAREVDLVLGLVTPARGVATAMHQVGSAYTPGRHIVMRGLDDEEEGRAIDAAYHLLSADERSRLYSDRRAHKEVVLFLHEWGHSAGLLHEEDRAMIMNPVYDQRQSGFSDFDKQVLALVVDKRLAHRDQLFPEQAELVALYEKAPAEVGSDKERAQLLDRLRSAPGPRSPSPPAQEARGGLPPVDAQAFNDAVAAAKANRPEQAWQAFAPLMQRLRDKPGTPEQWTRIAQLAVAIGALSAAEEAIGRVPRGAADIEKVAADVESIRQHMALPPARKSGLAPEQEPAYVAAFRTTADRLASGDLAAARAQVKTFAATFPDSAGADLLTCELEARANHAAIANQRCEAALAKYRFAQRAHVLLGLLAARAGRAALAEQHLQAAIHMDPRDSSAWRELARLFRAQRAHGRLDELGRRYEATFATPLPP